MQPSAESPAIDIVDLSKTFRGGRGIKVLTLAVRSGEVFGYLGPNGAGKTTTIRTLMGFLRPDTGGATVLGLDMVRDSLEIRRRVGYLPGELALFERMTGEQVLRHLAAMRGGVDRRRVAELAERLGADLSVQTNQLSHGGRQKIGLIQAFMHSPELLILDEPTLGLDPIVQQTFAELVKEHVRGGATVFLSSHVLGEVQHLCDRVGIIRDGILVTIESVDRLEARAIRRVEIHFSSRVPRSAFADVPGVTELTVHGRVVRCVITGALDPLVKAASRYTVVDLLSEHPSLEETFLAYYGSEPGHAA